VKGEVGFFSAVHNSSIFSYLFHCLPEKLMVFFGEEIKVI